MVRSTLILALLLSLLSLGQAAAAELKIFGSRVTKIGWPGLPVNSSARPASKARQIDKITSMRSDGGSFVAGRY